MKALTDRRLESLENAANNPASELLGGLITLSPVGRRFSWSNFEEKVAVAGFGLQLPNPPAPTAHFREALTRYKRDHRNLQGGTVREFWRPIQDQKSAKVMVFGLVREEIVGEKTLEHDQIATVVFMALDGAEPEILDADKDKNGYENPAVGTMREYFEELEGSAASTAAYKAFSNISQAVGGFNTALGKGLWFVPETGIKVIERFKTVMEENNFGHVSCFPLRRDSTGDIGYAAKRDLDQKVQEVEAKLAEFGDKTRGATVENSLKSLRELQKETELMVSLLGFQADNLETRIKDAENTILERIQDAAA